MGVESRPALDEIYSRHLPHLAGRPLPRTAIPELAKDPAAVRLIEEAVREVPTEQRLCLGDARRLTHVPDESVHLILTSPPYWTLKRYPDREGQLGRLEDYDLFVEQLNAVWAECFRVLVRGGRLVVVVGDVCLSRRKHRAHMVVPLHASIQLGCRQIGFHNLAPIIWYKIANAVFEVENGTQFLGKPYEPNAIIKNDIEYILMQRKPGGYRRPSDAMRVLSLIGEKDHRAWFNQILDLRGASTKAHPAPYPLELAERVIRMFSFVGDTVLDPFAGTGTTCVAAARWGRNGIGVEIEPSYLKIAAKRLAAEIAQGGLRATVTECASGT